MSASAAAIATGRSTPHLSGKTVALSISDNQDRVIRGFDRIHQNTFMYEVARALYRSGASIAYGGHLSKEGFTAASLQYLIDEQQSALEAQRIQSYVAWPLHCRTAASQNRLQDDFLRFADILALPAPNDFDGPKHEFLDSKPIPNRYYWFRSLTAMRRKMNSEIHARVIMGGKLHGFVGRYPGVVEETLFAVATGTPLYLCGGFGGAASALAQLFQGKMVPALELSSQYADEQYAASVGYYETATASKLRKELSRTTPYDRFVEYAVDCLLLCEFFRAVGVGGLNNGLSIRENEILFETPSLDEIRTLVLSGLTRLFRAPRETESSLDEAKTPSNAAFTRAMRAAGQPRSPLIDLHGTAEITADELLALESELFAVLSKGYLDARRLALPRCAPAILEQFGLISNARSLLSLDLATLNWTPARSDASAIAEFLTALYMANPGIAELGAVRRYLPSSLIRSIRPEVATRIMGSRKNPSIEVAMKAWFEDLPLDYTRAETRTAERLLITGYNTNAAALRLAENAGLDLASLPQAEPVRDLMHKILAQARRSDRLIQLLEEVLRDPDQVAIHPELRMGIAGFEGKIVAAAMRRKPKIATLAALPSSMEVFAPGSTAPKPLETSDLEKIINAAGFGDPKLLRFHLAEAEVRTARIDIGGKAAGSGFLVADSLLLTAWHVVKKLEKEDGYRSIAVFENRVSPVGKGEQDVGRAVSFAENWLVACSRHEPVDAEVGPDGPPLGNWDFAVVRLAEPVGVQAIGPNPVAVDGDKRGHYMLDGSPYHFDEAEPILIVGHPEGRPVQLSWASPSRVRQTKNGNRVRYQTNTEGGSAGSPVFNRNWRVVALHHTAGTTSMQGENIRSNQGIPIAGIVAELKIQLTGRPELAELGLA